MAKILVVDDEVGIRELLSDILSDEGYTVLSAENAEAARVFMAKEEFDLVMLDKFVSVLFPFPNSISTRLRRNAFYPIRCRLRNRRNCPSTPLRILELSLTSAKLYVKSESPWKKLTYCV